MSDIRPIGRPAPGALSQPNRLNSAYQAPSPPSRGRDEVELSQTARLLGKLHELPDIRPELVQRIRDEIAEGSYDTDEKLDAAVDKLIDELA